MIAQGVENKKAIDELVVIIANMEQQRANVHRKSNLEFKMSAIKAQMKNIDMQIENFKRQKE